MFFSGDPRDPKHMKDFPYVMAETETGLANRDASGQAPFGT